MRIQHRRESERASKKERVREEGMREEEREEHFSAASLLHYRFSTGLQVEAVRRSWSRSNHPQSSPNLRLTRHCTRRKESKSWKELQHRSCLSWIYKLLYGTFLNGEYFDELFSLLAEIRGWASGHNRESFILLHVCIYLEDRNILKKKI